eukprot:TRINITY_DN24255_c0_g1_i1.p1 TRINITY_DN24255_c0_g1~~TRINITY_DN24255_c0_g1_i1.p1  ORF type:complete len:412 (-),score=51.77 TRINITY_DN24255_c0_g1_i1:268-1503(-)
MPQEAANTGPHRERAASDVSVVQTSAGAEKDVRRDGGSKEAPPRRGSLSGEVPQPRRASINPEALPREDTDDGSPSLVLEEKALVKAGMQHSVDESAEEDSRNFLGRLDIYTGAPSHKIALLPLSSRSSSQRSREEQSWRSFFEPGGTVAASKSGGAACSTVTVKALRAAPRESPRMFGNWTAAWEYAEQQRSVSQKPPAAWEEGQRAEWVIKGLVMDERLKKLRKDGILVEAGQHIISKTFTLAGETCTLRFWPNGYFSKSQQEIVGPRNVAMGGLDRDAWCAVGLFMPPSTHLRIRFIVGDARSEVREVFWSSGTCTQQIWVPKERGIPYKALEDGLIVGVEVLQDMRFLKAVIPRRPGSKGIAKHGLSQGIAGLSTMRTAAGLVLPSPRFACANELKREPPRCRVGLT